MKTKTSLIAGLTTALLFGTAWSVAAIAFQPPKVRDNNIQKDADRTGSLPPASCKRWDVSGQWVLQQDNGINVQVNIQQGEWQQTSANLTGTATLIAQGAQPQPGGISGNITDFAFAMKLTTGSGIYRFTGKIGRGGKMEGTDNKGVHWIATSRMKCADATPEPIGSPTPRRPRS